MLPHANRRSGKTYGKANKNALVHDLFDYRGNHDVGSAAESSTGAILPPAQDTNPSQTPQDAAENMVNRTSADRARSPFRSHISDKQIASELKKSLIQDTSLFEMESSEGEASSDSSASRASKRRRVMKPLKATKIPVNHALESVQSKPEKVTEMSRGKVEKTQDKATMMSNTSTTKIIAARTVPEKPNSSGGKTQAQQVQAQQPSKLHSLPRNTSANKSLKPSGRSEASPMADYAGFKPSGYSSDHYERSPRLTGGFSRTKQLSPAGTESDLSSPSQLGINDLRLSATRPSPGPQSPDLSSDGSATRKRHRRRLIDRLDAPSTSAGNTSEDPVSDAASLSTQVKKLKPGNPSKKKPHPNNKDNQQQRSLSASRILQEPQSSVIVAAKPRMTYATQRSHLSDMVDDLDGASEPSQKTSDELLLALPVSNLASQLELENEESDDQTGANRLKSIHELRQAGANNRFNREVDALLDDIDVGEQSSKSIRLQALTKLITKLREPKFVSHVAASDRVQRLILTAGMKLDLLTSTLLTIVLLSLATAENVLPDTLAQIFRAASELAPDMLKEDRLLSSIAKDRKQNLSKAMIGDLIEFEKTARSNDTPSGISEILTPDMAALKCLEQSLRKLVRLGHSSVRPSTLLYTKLLQFLPSQIQYLHNIPAEPTILAKLQTALALLELFSLVVDDADLHIGDNEYHVLGNVLAEVIEKTNNSESQLEQSVLRVVVSLSNNKPRMCQLLGHTAIKKAAFSIIDTNFLVLAKQAENDQPLDEHKLDSVVLAIGCLLNFAECDPTLRSRLSEMKPGKDNHVEQLVSIFNSQVSKVDEAMTKEQGQVSVAFGYLSMLLCTLSLDANVQTQITRHLKSRSFEELCTAAEKFFSHLQTLEHMSEDDASMSTFTARFGVILDTVRAPGTD